MRDAEPSRPAAAVVEHQPALEAVRGWAILGVIAVHTSFISRAHPVDHWVTGLMRAGWAGVDLFFVLSGFLITGILLRARGGPRYFTSFYGRRVLRIFPLYLLAVFLLLIVAPRLPYARAEVYQQLARHQTWFWLHLSNIHFVLHGFTGDPTDCFWSLAVEEQFYLLWPLVVWFCPRSWLAWVCGGLMGLALAVRCGLIGAGAHPVWAYVLLPARMDAIAAGGLVAVLLSRPANMTALRKWAGLILLLCAAVISVMFIREHTLPFWNPLMQTMGYSTLAAGFAAGLLLVASAPHGVAARVVNHAPLRTLGRYSYCLYLCHLPLVSVCRQLHLHRLALPAPFGSSLVQQMFFSGLVLGAALVIALVSWKLIEQPCLALKKYFPYGVSTGNVSPADSADSGNGAALVGKLPPAKLPSLAA